MIAMICDWLTSQDCVLETILNIKTMKIPAYNFFFSVSRPGNELGTMIEGQNDHFLIN